MPADPRGPAPTADLSALLATLSHRFQQRLRSSPVLATLGLSPLQARLVAFVGRAPPDHATAARFAAATGRDKGQVARLVRDLCAAGLLLRRPHPADGRVAVLGLTPAGQDAALQLLAHRARVRDEMLAGFSPDEAAALAALLGRLIDNLGPAPASG